MNPLDEAVAGQVLAFAFRDELEKIAAAGGKTPGKDPRNYMMNYGMKGALLGAGAGGIAGAVHGAAKTPGDWKKKMVGAAQHSALLGGSSIVPGGVVGGTVGVGKDFMKYRKSRKS